jgi:hypothetical protein
MGYYVDFFGRLTDYHLVTYLPNYQTGLYLGVDMHQQVALLLLPPSVVVPPVLLVGDYSTVLHLSVEDCSTVLHLSVEDY